MDHIWLSDDSVEAGRQQPYQFCSCNCKALYTLLEEVVGRLIFSVCCHQQCKISTDLTDLIKSTTVGPWLIFCSMCLVQFDGLVSPPLVILPLTVIWNRCVIIMGSLTFCFPVRDVLTFSAMQQKLCTWTAFVGERGKIMGRIFLQF